MYCSWQLRLRHTHATLSYVLPWLRQSGYEVVTLSQAHTLAGYGGPLTAESLALHNQTVISPECSSAQDSPHMLVGQVGEAQQGA